MGYSLAWIAVRGKSAQQVRSELGLKGTGQKCEIPEKPLMDVSLPTKWHLVISEEFLFHGDDKLLSELSKLCEIQTCAIEEHAMFSAASFWKDGRKIWELMHESDQGIEHLAVEGEPPSSFTAI